MGMSGDLRNSCQYQNLKIDNAITTTTNKPDEFIFCFNRQRFLLLSIQCGNFPGWTLFLLLLVTVVHKKKKKKKNMAD